MKRIISAMLAVIICVLTLSGCEKTPTGQESSSGSSFTESDEASVSEVGAENSESEDSEQEESFDYTGWQEFCTKMNAHTCEIYSFSDENRKRFSGTDPSYPATVTFKLPEDFKIRYDVYGDGFHSGTKFDFYPLRFFLVNDKENDKEIEYTLKVMVDFYGSENIALSHNIYVVLDDFSEPWYDYPVVKEARGDPDWMCAYHYYIYAEIDGGILEAAVIEYGAFDENYDMTEAVDFIKQLIKTVSVTVDYDSQS